MKPESIDAYIELQRQEIHPILHKFRDTIRNELPEATEKLAWNMPTWWQVKNLVHFAASKNHITFHPSKPAIAAFSEQLDVLNIDHTDMTIRFPYKDPIPDDLVADMVRWTLNNLG